MRLGNLALALLLALPLACSRAPAPAQPTALGPYIDAGGVVEPVGCAGAL